jgi:hypothetical protein
MRKVHALDLEVLEMVLRTLTRIHDLEESPDPHVEGVTLDSADGHFRIELLVEGQEQATLRALLLDLMAENPLGFSRLMEALRWEIPSELEETALRFRWARLSDLGFPDPESAAGLYSQVPIPRSPAAPSGALARTGGRAALIDAALGGSRRRNRRPRWRSCVASTTRRWWPMAPTREIWTPSVPRPSVHGTRSGSGWSCCAAGTRPRRRRQSGRRRCGASSRSASRSGCA